jgi:hypothetical protein
MLKRKKLGRKGNKNLNYLNYFWESDWQIKGKMARFNIIIVKEST